MSACKACGGHTEWDPDVGSQICTQCGTLEDASQVVLSSQLEPHELGSGRDRAFAGASLKSLRAPGWNLAGQGKEARDARNKAAMHEFMKTLAGRLGYPGLAERAGQIFDMAMARGRFRWGRKAKLTAAAGIAIACREAHKADPLRDLAVFIDESPTSVARAYTATAALVGYAGGSADPSLHLSALKAHVVGLLRPPDGSPPPVELPPALGKELATLLPHLLAIERTASLLCALFGRLSTFAQLSTPPTACALFTLALEAEARKPLSAAAVWAGVLGARFGCAGSTVQSRYKLAYDIAENWVSELPWANTYKKVGSRAKTARAKEGKRAIVAQSLKDAVEFQEEIWSKKVDAASKLVVVLEEDEGEESDSSMPSVTSSKRSAPDGELSAEEFVRAQYSRKRRKKAPKEVDTASAFLLSPSNSASPATAASSKKSTRSQPAIKAEEDLCLLTHLLSADPHTLSLSHQPTRLQILATARGGADVEHVRDDELFEEGELENILRPPEEVDAFARTVDWPDELPATVPRRQGRGPRPKAPKGSQRVDMDKLARLLGEQSPGDVEEDGKEDGDVWDDFVAFDVWSPDIGFAPEDDKDDDSECEDVATGVLRSAPASGSGLSTGFHGAEDEEVEEWRPPSPGGADGGDYYDF